MRIINFNVGATKAELVAGLTWEPLKTGASKQTLAIKEYQVQEKYDLKVLRGTDQIHVGLTHKIKGAKKGQLSAAAIIADKVSAIGDNQNFLAVIKVPYEEDLYLFVAASANTILVDGDIAGTRDEIQSKFKEFVAFGGWSCICPADWAVLNSKELTFEEVFTEASVRANRKYALADISIEWSRILIPAVVIVAVVFSAYFGWTYWSKKRAEEAQRLRIQAEEVARGQRLAVTGPPKPWPALPDVVSFAKACNQALNDVGLSAGNWTLGKISCVPGSLTISWTKASESAWISHLLQVRPNAAVSADGLMATVVVPVTVAPSNAFSETLPQREGISHHFFDLASRYGMAVRIEQPQSTAPQALPGRNMPGAAPEAQPTWDSLNITVETKIDAAEASSILANPGLRFKQINYSLNSGVMQIQLLGVQYVLR